MDTVIVSDKLESRKRKALTLAAADQVEVHADGYFLVWSQSDPTTSYQVTLPDPFFPASGSCSCPDRFRPCKHILAASLAIRAERQINISAEEGGISRATIGARARRALANAPDEHGANRLAIIMHAATRLAQRETQLSAELELVIEYRTTGGRHMPTIIGEGQIKTIIENGQEREPKTTGANRAFKWLQRKGYEPISHRWIDPAGRHRRKRHLFRLAGA